MKESEIFVCKRCGNEHEALTQEIASFSCPNLSKTKTKLKVLDSVSLNLLTELINSSETQDLKTNSVSQNGASKYGTSK